MSAKPTNFDQLANLGENHEKRIHRLEEKDQDRDDELRGPEGVHTNIAIMKRELAQIIWLGKIILAVLVGLVVTDFYRTIKTSQHERVQVEHMQQQAQKTASTPTKQN
jgi:predicted histidine transporter YuiF (NhaC family)